MKVAILGSGSSAAASAAALKEQLTNKGIFEQTEISIIDFGLDQSVSTSHRSVEGNRTRGPATKNNYDKDHVFDIPTVFQTKSALDASLAGSAAYAGWSEVWGATLQPYTDWGLGAWPLGTAPNRGDFESVRRLISDSLPGVSLLGEGDLGEEVRRAPSLLVERQFGGQKLLQVSRLAVSNVSERIERGCSQCGKCLSGCPGDHIWSARQYWSDFLRYPNVNYTQGAWIYRVEEGTAGVSVTYRDSTQALKNEQFDMVFVGLGAMQTAALLIRSDIACDGIVKIRDSRMILMPFIMKRLKRTGSNVPRIALSEAFLVDEADSHEVSLDFFAQLYGNSPEFQARVLAEHPILRFIPPSLRRGLLSRLGVGMCFFDETVSDSISVTISGDSTVNISPEIRKNSKETKRIARWHFSRFGLRGLSMLSQQVTTGLGYHFGSSFPMLGSPTSPGMNSSDDLGRPNGCQAIFLIDSSSLPRITATPTTFTTMANAFAIVRRLFNGAADD